MATFRQLYLNSCAEAYLEPDLKILSILDEVSNASILNFSEYNFGTDTCKVLGQSLAKEVFITELDFSNCMLPEEGLIEILRGLELNKSVYTLSLKGNSLRSSGAQALGKLLRHNDYLQHLDLRWNALGILPDKFFIFCEGLSSNSSLKSLDLVSNQLNHQCGASIANALAKNSTLETLALQWNNLGLIGGQSLLKALFKNRSLTKLDIAGNQVPSEVENGIGIAITRNSEKIVSTKFYAEQARMLSHKLDEAVHDKNSQLKIMEDALEICKNEAAKNEKFNTMKLAYLENEMAEKDMEFNKLSEKSKRTELELGKTAKELGETTAKLEQSEAEGKTREIELLGENIKLQDKIMSFEKQTQDLHQCKNQLLKDVQKLNSDLLRLENEGKLKTDNLNAQIVGLKEQYEASLKEKDEFRSKELAKVKAEFEKTDSRFQHRIECLESQNIELENEVMRLKNQITSEKLRSQGLLDEEKLKWKRSEEKLEAQLEEKLLLVESAKSNLEAHLRQQLDVMHDLKTKSTALNYELEEQCRYISSLEKQLDEANEKCKLEVAKAKLELQEKLKELEDEQMEKERLAKKIETLDERIKVLEKEKGEMMASTQKKHEEMKSKIDQVLNEESDRAVRLQSAFLSYFSEVKQATTQVPM